jgi:hypothetical protein
MRRGLRNLGYALVGWHDPIRIRSPHHAQAQITLLDVGRDWLHEIHGRWGSLFFVTATITPPDGSRSL